MLGREEDNATEEAVENDGRECRRCPLLPYCCLSATMFGMAVGAIAHPDTAIHVTDVRLAYGA